MKMKFTRIISLAIIFLLLLNIYHCRITKNQKSRRGNNSTGCREISEKIRKSKSVLSVDEMKKIIGDTKCGTAYSRTTIEELQKANKHSINPKDGKDVSEQEVDKVRREIMDSNEKFIKEKLPLSEKEIIEFQNNDQKNKLKFKFKEIFNRNRFSNERVGKILGDLRNSSCAESERYLSFYAKAGTRHTIICNTRAVFLSTKYHGFCANNQNGPISFDGSTILYLRFAYAGDHYVTFANALDETGAKVIIAIQSFQNIFRARKYYMNEQNIINHIQNVQYNTSHYKWFSTLCLVTGPLSNDFSNDQIKTMISWFKAYEYYSATKVDTATIYRPWTSSPLPTPEEFMEPLDFNNNFAESEVNQFFPDLAGSLEEKIRHLKNMLEKLC